MYMVLALFFIHPTKATSDVIPSAWPMRFSASKRWTCAAAASVVPPVSRKWRRPMSIAPTSPSWRAKRRNTGGWEGWIGGQNIKNTPPYYPTFHGKKHGFLFPVDFPHQSNEKMLFRKLPFWVLGCFRSVFRSVASGCKLVE